MKIPPNNTYNRNGLVQFIWIHSAGPLVEPLKPLETFILVGILKTFYLAEKPLITFILINKPLIFARSF